MTKVLFVTRRSLARFRDALQWKDGRLVHASCGSPLSEVVAEREVRSRFAVHQGNSNRQSVSSLWCRTCESVPPNGEADSRPLLDRDLAEVVL